MVFQEAILCLVKPHSRQFCRYQVNNMPKFAFNAPFGSISTRVGVSCAREHKWTLAFQWAGSQTTAGFQNRHRIAIAVTATITKPVGGLCTVLMTP